MINRTTSTLGVLCAFAARPVEYRLDQDRVVRSKRYSTGGAIAYPIFTHRAKITKNNIFLFLRTWRPLRLCGSPRGISFPQKRCLFIHGIISRGES
ncbi:MAG: hypothetical protein ACE10H_09735, partial [Candidatus Binatia bacterium]